MDAHKPTPTMEKAAFLMSYAAPVCTRGLKSNLLMHHHCPEPLPDLDIFRLIVPLPLDRNLCKWQVIPLHYNHIRSNLLYILLLLIGVFNPSENISQPTIPKYGGEQKCQSNQQLVQ